MFVAGIMVMEIVVVVMEAKGVVQRLSLGSVGGRQKICADLLTEGVCTGGTDGCGGGRGWMVDIVRLG